MTSRRGVARVTLAALLCACCWPGSRTASSSEPLDAAGGPAPSAPSALGAAPSPTPMAAPSATPSAAPMEAPSAAPISMATLQALASARPLREKDVAVFRRANAEGYFSPDAILLANNGSPRALDLLGTMLADRAVPAS